MVASAVVADLKAGGNVVAAELDADDDVRGLSQDAHLTAVLLFCTMHAEHLIKSFVLTSQILFAFGVAATSAVSELSQETHLVALFKLGTMQAPHLTLSVATVAHILTAGVSDFSFGLVESTVVVSFRMIFSLGGTEEVAFVMPLRFPGGENMYFMPSAPMEEGVAEFEGAIRSSLGSSKMNSSSMALNVTVFLGFSSVAAAVFVAVVNTGFGRVGGSILLKTCIFCLGSTGTLIASREMSRLMGL